MLHTNSVPKPTEHNTVPLSFSIRSDRQGQGNNENGNDRLALACFGVPIVGENTAIFLHIMPELHLDPEGGFSPNSISPNTLLRGDEGIGPAKPSRAELVPGTRGLEL